MPRPKPNRPAKEPIIRPAAPIIAAIDAFQTRLASLILDRGEPTPQEVREELMTVARLAASVGNLEAAIKGYEAVGKILGLNSETHNHLHLHSAGAMLAAGDAEIVTMLKGGTLGTQKIECQPQHSPEPAAATPADAESLLA